jgi:hypothetical protein
LEGNPNTEDLQREHLFDFRKTEGFSLLRTDGGSEKSVETVTDLLYSHDSMPYEKLSRLKSLDLKKDREHDSGI